MPLEVLNKSMHLVKLICEADDKSVAFVGLILIV